VDVGFFCEKVCLLESCEDIIERRLVFGDEKGVVDVDENYKFVVVE